MSIEQRRIVRTEIPGPRSKELHARRQREVPPGFGNDTVAKDDARWSVKGEGGAAHKFSMVTVSVS